MTPAALLLCTQGRESGANNAGNRQTATYPASARGGNVARFIKSARYPFRIRMGTQGRHSGHSLRVDYLAWVARKATSKERKLFDPCLKKRLAEIAAIADEAIDSSDMPQHGEESFKISLCVAFGSVAEIFSVF